MLKNYQIEDILIELRANLKANSVIRLDEYEIDRIVDDMKTSLDLYLQ